MTESQASRRSRLTLILLIALFLAPVLAAVLLNSRWSDYRPQATRNHGTLIQPVAPLPAALREALPGGEVWMLLWSARCSAGCVEQLDLLDRMDRALGRHAQHFQPVLISDGALGEIPATVQQVTDGDQFRAYFDAQLHGADHAYLIDPLGNAMMQYPADFDPSGVIDDLERLLKYSRPPVPETES